MEDEMSRKNKVSWLEVVQLTAAAGLFLAPWALGFADLRPAAWNAWVTAGGVLLFATLISVGMADWSGWGTLALGLWAIIAPAALGFLTSASGLLSHIVAGAVITISAIAVLVMSMRPAAGADDGMERARG
jgi:hypothetical protein